MRPPPEMGVRWPKQAHHTSQMDRLRIRGEELAMEAPARPSGRDGVMALPPPPRRRWLLEGAGAAFQHLLTASTVTYDESEHCPIRLRAWADSQAKLGAVLEAAHAYGVRLLTAYTVHTRVVETALCEPASGFLKLIAKTEPNVAKIP